MIRGQGMPSYRHHDYGNMYIQFDVKFPEKNWTENPAAFEALRKFLPAPELVNTPPADAMTEPADLEDVDASSSSRGFNGAAADDDEEHEPHAERVQCASQ
jgi:DnaJ family protein A protein 2